MKFGEKLKTLRKKRDLTQDQVASAIGVSRRAYIAYEQNNTRPRKQETYDLLAKTLDCDVNYLRIEEGSKELGASAAALVAASTALGTIVSAPVGMAAFFAGAGTILGLHSNRKKNSQSEKQLEPLTYTNDMLLQYEKRQKRFAATALGVLYSTAAKKGFVCQPGNLSALDALGGRPDDCILVSDNEIHEWWLIFWAKDSELDSQIIMLAEDRAGVLMSRFATAAANPNRMASIIVDDIELFDAVCRYKNHNSYRGNLSVLLLDTEDVSVVKEEMISQYSDSEPSEQRHFSIL